MDLGGTGRANTGARHFIEWQFSPANPLLSRGGLTVRLRQTGEAALETGLYKFGLDYDARLAADGVMSRSDDANGGLEMIVTGLAPGLHTIATYHNSLLGPDQPLGRFNVYVNNVLTLSNLQPSIQVTNDYDIASAFVRVKAEAGKDVVLKFSPAGSDGRASVVLNGFEIDSGNPAARATKPSPASDDEHVSGDNGAVKLLWTAPAAVASHDVYFGTNPDAVAAADRKSPLFKGNQKTIGFTAANINPTESCYWRVDEINASNEVAKGDVWNFRSRRLAFPTAEGYGRFARGGRGGRVIEVTNLNDHGPGSLRAAVEADGPRTVVFNVSGLITLESRLIIKNPYLTIAGQTAPGQGICIRKYNMGIGGSHDVVVRYV
ncbi:MAG TPA: T9SS C-terminal target domain-containing protein, partial [Blastocatellia bacterium]|nr:T9SS C-terminal target domain-containing protein [Blastocatellia bacterium]